MSKEGGRKKEKIFPLPSDGRGCHVVTGEGERSSDLVEGNFLMLAPHNGIDVM